MRAARKEGRLEKTTGEMPMSVPESVQWVDAEDYLRGEQDGQVRHEFVAGRVYAMTGGSVYHNRIAGAFFAVLREKLGNRPCDVFMADMKVEVRQAFYYPDIMVVCDPTDLNPYTKTRPLLIAEVISPTTRSIDEREKRAAYQGLESLREYLLIEQDRAEVRAIRRRGGNAWEEESYGLADDFRLESLDRYISMRDLYEGAWR
jgi:Uma2 family endonuclease